MIDKTSTQDNNAIRVKAESNFIDPAVKSKNELKDWILAMLGAPLITVELTEVQLDACIQTALNFYTKYAFFGPDKYLVVDLNNYEHQKGLNLEMFHIASVKDVSFERDNAFSTGGDLFWGPYAWLAQGNGLYPMSNNYGSTPTMGNWVTWHSVVEFFELTKRMTGSNPSWQYDKNTKYLTMMPEPPKFTNRPHFILLTCQVMPSFAELYGNEYVMRMCLAQCKMLLGTVRKKFQSIQLIGGGQIDTSIGDEGKEEWNQLTENIIANEAKGQCWFIA